MPVQELVQKSGPVRLNSGFYTYMTWLTLGVATAGSLIAFALLIIAPEWMLAHDRYPKAPLTAGNAGGCLLLTGILFAVAIWRLASSVTTDGEVLVVDFSFPRRGFQVPYRQLRQASSVTFGWSRILWVTFESDGKRRTVHFLSDSDNAIEYLRDVVPEEFRTDE